MPDTFTLIASSTVGAGGAANIQFSSIPSTFTDLCLKYSVRGGASFAAGYVVFYVNGDTSSSYSARWVIGDGSSAGSGGGTGTSSYTRIIGGNQQATATGSTFTNGELYIPNYANTSYNKSASGDGVGENNATTAFAMLTANLWPSTAAINSLSIANYDSGGLVQHSTAYLYGIKKD